MSRRASPPSYRRSPARGRRTRRPEGRVPLPAGAPSAALPYDYVARTRAVPANLLFLVPFVLIYEFALIGTKSPVENAAGAWVRALWTRAGHGAFLASTLILGVVFLLVVWRRAHDAPKERGLYGGMLVEGTVYGLCLGLVAQGLSAALPMERAEAITASAGAPPAILATLSLGLRDVGLALGAGVFEELLFRGALLAGVLALLRYALGADRWSASLVALLVSSYVFSAYHHWGAFGEPYHAGVFAFRFHAGIVLGALFLTRGLGIAALAHGVYDVLVTVG
jgi:membrane protease YdiL (CAAX protease family)